MDVTPPFTLPFCCISASSEVGSVPPLAVIRFSVLNMLIFISGFKKFFFLEGYSFGAEMATAE